MVSPIDDIFKKVVSKGSSLPEQQAKVLSFVAEGLTTVEIGEKIFIRGNTVAHYKGLISKRLDVKGEYEMLLAALLYAAVSGKKVDFPETGALNFTQRQRELFESRGNGNRYRDIGVEFGISPKTVNGIFDKYVNQQLIAWSPDGTKDRTSHSYLWACAAWNVVVKPYVQSHPEVFGRR